MTLENNRGQLTNTGEVLDRIKQGELSTEDALRVLYQMLSASAPAEFSRGEKSESLKEIMKELDALVGLKHVKGLVHELEAFVRIQNERRKLGLKAEPMVLHMISKGNPGTGKTTVARIIGKILRELGVLSKGHLVEVERADLVGEYIGHTAQKTREQIKKAMGGILFIDEAYSLARGGEKDFGKEAIDTLVKAMEDYKDDLVLILAGYRREMDEFLRTNPGLRSRFPIHLEYEDYSINELLTIGDRMVAEREYRLTGEAREKLRSIIEANRAKTGTNFSNARLVRNIIEKAIRRQAVRLVGNGGLSREELMNILPEDVEDVPGQ